MVFIHNCGVCRRTGVLIGTRERHRYFNAANRNRISVQAVHFQAVDCRIVKRDVTGDLKVFNLQSAFDIRVLQPDFITMPLQ
ncbi:hypothetical protein CQA17_16845 [Klebsiella pneumoniae]|nr:hypothetical protein CQA17_16845 [Klebsiella pneumoniae]PCP48991.1 hypothetical protein CQA39_16715 [Klebsiella pneumoniae]TAI79402.1 hypothetical protein C1459_02615 [Klebsiella pneumoniae]